MTTDRPGGQDPTTGSAYGRNQRPLTPGNPLARLTTLVPHHGDELIGAPPAEPAAEAPPDSGATAVAEQPAAAVTQPAAPASGATNEPAAGAGEPSADSWRAAEAAAPARAPTAQPASSPPSPAMGIGRLEHVEPSAVWPSSEAFAAWVAGNADAVGEAVGVGLGAGEAFEPCAVVADLSDGSGRAAIVVELGTTSDDGLGNLLRVVAASGATAAIWVCAEPSDGHMATVSWLNRSIEGRFFLVRCSAVTIGGSTAAPVFAVAVRTPRAADPGVDASPAVDEPRQASPERRAEDWLADLDELGIGREG